MNIKQIMNANVELVSPSTTIKEAAEIMSSRNIGFLPVGDDELRGTTTDRDITLRAVGQGKDIQNTKVSDILTGDVLYCYDDAEVEQVAHNMKDQQVRRLPVINADKKLVGVVSLGDLAPHLSAETAHELLKGVTHDKAA